MPTTRSPRRAGVRHRVRLAVLRAGALPEPAEEAAEVRRVARQREGGDGLPGTGRGVQVLPHRRARRALADRSTSPTTWCSAGWVAIAVACGLYLLNVYRLPHDEEKPNIGVPRLLFALSFLGLGVYLLPALFKGADGKPQRPGGVVYAWVDAFLLPEPEAPRTGAPT